MQCLKKHSDCSVRELCYNLSYSGHTVCGILHGHSQSMRKYIELSNYILEEINWTADFSGVSEILAHTLEHRLQLKLTAYDTRTCEVKEEIVILYPGIKE